MKAGVPKVGLGHSYTLSGVLRVNPRGGGAEESKTKEVTGLVNLLWWQGPRPK